MQLLPLLLPALLLLATVLAQDEEEVRPSSQRPRRRGRFHKHGHLTEEQKKKFAKNMGVTDPEERKARLANRRARLQNLTPEQKAALAERRAVGLSSSWLKFPF